MAGPASTDVPDRYDVVFSLNDGTTYGFLYADSVESNLPFRTHKALYSYSPTFLERQNLSNTYGDDYFDFFLTGTQADFSEGEGQKFFRVNDPDSVRKYWDGKNVDPSTTPGDVVLTPALVSVTTTGLYWCPVTTLSSLKESGASGYSWVGSDKTNLYGINSSGTATTIGANGIGVSVAGTIYTSTDGVNVYISSERTGSVGIRKYNGFTFSTFSATTVSQTLYINNILYGYQSSTDSLISFDTSGNATTQFQWKNGDGTTISTSFIKMVPYGGSIYILRTRAQAELWVYDGSGCRMVAAYPDDFQAKDIAVSQGIIYVTGYTTLSRSAYRPQVYYYANGSVGKLWESRTTSPSANTGSICPFGNGVVFQNPVNQNILQYDLALGGVHTITSPGVFAFQLTTSDITSSVLIYTGSISSTIYNATGNYSSSGYMQTSQYDFDNTLSKVFRGIKVDADIPANTSVDIAYQLDGAGGTYTNLQTGAASGTEYFLPASTTGHSISVQITLNSATGSATPTLKHVYVRAAPILQQFRRREYLFDLSGGSRDELGKSSRRTRDMTAYPKDPITACNDLVKIATQTIPFTVYDRFTTAGMTVIADLQQNQAGYDGFAIYEVRPNVFIGRINLREV